MTSPTPSDPFYENIDELVQLKRPSVSEFLKSLPPPPPPNYDEVDCSQFLTNRTSSTTSAEQQQQQEKTMITPTITKDKLSTTSSITSTCSSVSSSASSRRYIISNSSSVPPPSPHFSSYDMRPLSLPHKEMQRIEREQSHRSVLTIEQLSSKNHNIPSYHFCIPVCTVRVLIITLLVITIFIIMIAFSIYMYYDQIESHLNTIAESF